MLHGCSLGATWLLQVRISMLLLSVVGASQALGIDESHEEGLAVLAFTVIEELVHEALAATAAMHEDILQLLELVHVHLHLEVGPSRVFAHVAAAEAIVGTLDRKLRAALGPHRGHSAK